MLFYFTKHSKSKHCIAKALYNNKIRYLQTLQKILIEIWIIKTNKKYSSYEKALFNRVEELMSLSKDSLEKKRVFVQDMYERGLYPYTKRYLPHFNNHFSTIGINGVNEMLKNFFDESVDLSTQKGIEFTIKLLDFMRSKMVQYQEETGNLYNLEATPAEGTTYRFAKEDIKRYPEIIQAGMNKNIYYTKTTECKS